MGQLAGCAPKELAYYINLHEIFVDVVEKWIDNARTFREFEYVVNDEKDSFTFSRMTLGGSKVSYDVNDMLSSRKHCNWILKL